MKTCRAAAGSTGPNGTRRRGTITTSPSFTRSHAATCPVSGIQCGSKCSRESKCGAICSTHDARIGATVLSHRRLVSTTSAETTRPPCSLGRLDPGQIDARTPSTVTKSPSRSRPSRGLDRSRGTFAATPPTSPRSTARCTRTGSIESGSASGDGSLTFQMRRTSAVSCLTEADHSRSAAGFRRCRRAHRRCELEPPSASRADHACQSRSVERKSDRLSRRCGSESRDGSGSALSRPSLRSARRGSGAASAAARTIASAVQPSSMPPSTIRARRGSSGSMASRRATGPSRSMGRPDGSVANSIAPISRSVRFASSIRTGEGGSIHGKDSIGGSLRWASSSIVPARPVRRISGGVNSGRLASSSSA